MSEFVAISTLPDADVSFKREALVFQRIGIHSFKSDLNQLRSTGVTHSGGYFETLEWLFDRGIIFEPECLVGNINLTTDPQHKKYLQDYRKYKKTEEAFRAKLERNLHRKDANPRSTIQLFFEGVVASTAADDILSRIFSLQLRRAHNLDAHALVKTESISSFSSPDAGKSTLNIVLKTMPSPDQSVSWEQILEYRSDPDSWSKFLALRNWMSEIARTNLTPIEVEQKLEYLMDQYRRHMEVHRMKTNAGVFETVVTAAAEVAEDLARFRWGKIAKGLFALKHRRMTLLEGELRAPGAEVAYIVKATEVFSHS